MQGFVEVETPMMQPIAGGAVARPFVTHHNALDIDLFLRIAPELYLKRLMVGGFRAGLTRSIATSATKASRAHNPEFTMLEFYQAYADYQRLMGLTEQLIEHAGSRRSAAPIGEVRLAHDRTGAVDHVRPFARSRGGSEAIAAAFASTVDWIENRAAEALQLGARARCLCRR